jgi:uncharacterized protein (TIGR03000 family)
MRPLHVLALLAISASGLGTRLEAASNDPAPATIRVALPADAKLTFDGEATKSTSADRLFITPPLQGGKSFHYSLKCQFVRAGKTISVQQNVAVQAGRETRVSLYAPADGLEPSQGSGESAYDARSYYSGPASAAPPVAATAVAPVRVVVPRLGPAPSGGGFRPIHWGPDPGDPFYQSYAH